MAVGEDREEVYYSFRHDGQWYPDAAINWKQFRYNPSMVKVQVQRRLRDSNGATSTTLRKTFSHPSCPELEHRLARADALKMRGR